MLRGSTNRATSWRCAPPRTTICHSKGKAWPKGLCLAFFMPTCTFWTALAVRPLPAALSIVGEGGALPTLAGFRWLMLNLRCRRCWYGM